ncbi:MAG TPA: RNA polymerase sigma factor region1.1 domain-containing protein, partial [Pilimelia sp.]|nr:RNA polymerase sigma factor region1.1 domain-containing protein [Pilimelia sp.]
MTDARHIGADVRSITDALIAHAEQAGGQLTSAEVARTVETAEVTPAQAKKILRALADSGVTVVVDGSASTRRKVAAARAATPASKATTAKTTKPAPKKAPAAPAGEAGDGGDPAANGVLANGPAANGAAPAA